MKLISSVMFSMLLLLCQSVYALTITHVSHHPRFVDFSLPDSQLKINFSLDQAASVEISFFDDRDFLIRKIVGGALKEGPHTIVWDGKDQSGHRVPPEAYKYTIQASANGKIIEHDLSDFTGGVDAQVYGLKWNRSQGNVEFNLRKPGRVNIRIGMSNDGPLLATIIDWLPRMDGSHSVAWNGRDNSGFIEVEKLKDYEFYTQAFTLSENTIVVGPQVAKSELIDIDPEKVVLRVAKKDIRKKMKKHSQQRHDKRGDFVIEVALPDDLPKNAEGIPIVSKMIPIRFKLSASDQERMMNERFEPILFIDGVYEVENEVGFFPMTWNWNPQKLTEGEHILTVNLRGYDGHYGAASIKVYVKK